MMMGMVMIRLQDKNKKGREKEGQLRQLTEQVQLEKKMTEDSNEYTEIGDRVGQEGRRSVP